MSVEGKKKGHEWQNTPFLRVPGSSGSLADFSGFA